MYGPMGGLMPNVFPAGNIGPPHPSVPMPLMPNMVMPYQLPAMPPPPADYRPEEIDSSVQGALASLSAIFPALQHPTPVVLVRMLLLERVKEKRPHTAFRNVVDGLRWITATADVAAQAKAKLLELREGYLAGEPLHPLPVSKLLQV